MMRRVLAIALATVTLAPPAFAAYGLPHWSFLEFVENTQIGAVRVKVELDTKASPRQVTTFEIRVDGKKLSIPREVMLFIKDPRLDEVSLQRVASVTCIGDECPWPDSYPAELHIPYGREFYREAGDERCTTSEMSIEFFAEEITSASYYECTEDGDGPWITLSEKQ